ncbi:peptidylprolyl isomerase [Sphingomonas sp.]|jgi:peptidylprolyl isomerase|uniref:peptidylprolyl isomerase n=1 Tax=Sphingomonas sp. TaxID=28214 RepID=UPI002D800F0B|nr:peptidylprolyl isomerase [Sphingomonas sp.]HEU0045146.1 peptidylprolyl isomerase [Sphingomonas sp.]
MRILTLLALLLGLFLAGSATAQGLTLPPPTPAPEPENTLLLDLSSGGRVAIQLRPDVAPNHVARIKELARKGFYNGLTFHRVIDGFMAQGGDPAGDGTGGSDLPDLKAEFNGLPHVRGAIAAARQGAPQGADAAAVAAAENSANSQFYIMLGSRLSLDGRYTVFGRVISGMNFVDALERGEPPENPSVILQASIAADNKAPPAPGQVLASPAAALRAAPRGPSAAGPAVPPPPSIRLPESKPKAPPKKSR